MILHTYDDAGRLSGRIKARPDPKNTGEFLRPRNTTDVTPPEHQDGFVRVWDGNAWEQKESFRGRRYWLPNDPHDHPGHENEDDFELPEDALDAPPAEPQIDIDRRAVRQVWRDAPVYIKGAFYGSHQDIDNLLASDQIPIATQLVTHLDAPSDYNPTQLTRFEQFKADYLAAIDAMSAGAQQTRE